MTVTTPDPTLAAIRSMYAQFPGLQRTLLDVSNRRRMHSILRNVLRAGAQNNFEESIDQLVEVGALTNAEADRARMRLNTAPRSAPLLNLSPTSQAGRLLRAYNDADGVGMTALEAAASAGVPESSGYWKRVSDLLNAGLISAVEGESRERRRVYVVTDEGRSRVASMMGS